MSEGAPPLILSVFATFAVGGPQVRFAALANRFGARWRHALVAMDGRTDCIARINPDVPFRLLPAPPSAGGIGLSRFRAIRRTLRTLSPKVMLTSNWGSIEWAAMARTVPSLRHIHMEDGFNPDEISGQKPRRVQARRLILRASTIVLPSMRLLKIAREDWRLPERNLHYIPNGLDLARYCPHGEAAHLAPAGEGPVIGTVAKLRTEKNLSRLLRAAALLHGERIPFRLLIVGDGPERPVLEALANTLGIAHLTRFAGNMSDPAAVYRAMDVFALSSDTEQMPFSVLEAMASGLSVAATDVGDVSLMLAAENTPYLAPRDDAALARALGPLLADPGLRAALGRANRAKAERDYGQETMFGAYAALIEAGSAEGRR